MKTTMNVISAALLAIGLLSSCGERGEGEKANAIRPVRAMTVGDTRAMDGRRWPGKAQATQEVNLSFRVSGPLIARPGDVGVMVKKGDLLAKLDPRDFEVRLRNSLSHVERARAELRAMEVGARPEDIAKLHAAVSSARSALEFAGGEFERVTRIRTNDQGAMSQRELDRQKNQRDDAEAALTRAEEDLRIGQTGAREEDIAAKKAEIRSLEAAVEAARDALQYTELRAPFDGTVSAAFVENYQTVQVNQAIMRLLDSTQVEFVVHIPESLISLARMVVDIQVTYDAFPGQPVSASIKHVGPEASRRTRTYPVTLIMKQPTGFTVLPGMAGYATCRLEESAVAERGVLEIPLSAIFADTEDRKWVWIVDEGSLTVARHEVAPGELTVHGIHVQGLRPGQMIASAGVHSLVEGQKVRILRNGPKEAVQ